MFKKGMFRARKIKTVSLSLKNQFRQNVVTAIIAAFGIIIAFVWKDVIESAVNLLIDTLGIDKGAGLVSKLAVAFFVTVVSVIGIFIFSRYRPKE